MNRLTSAVLSLSLLVLPSLAHADITTAVVGTSLGGIASGVAFTSIDLMAKPSSKAYGVTEAVVNGAFVVGGVINLATMSGEHGDAVKPIVAGIALWNAVLVVHGVYVATRSHSEPVPVPAVAFRVGHARGALAPTALTDGDAVAAGLGVFGSF